MTATEEISYGSRAASRPVHAAPASTAPLAPSSPARALCTPGETAYTPSHNGLILTVLDVRKVMVTEGTLSLDLEKGVGVFWKEGKRGFPVEDMNIQGKEA